ncbi:hypothetical protein [Marinitoga sp. 1138]|uniref:hypothetical protein n=1 Tax=Marinitoga sp. 1138 TaxID=1643334 RepID=UPI001585D8DD|nr:hypothetical protein [Marinitoga sp. 1138]NUU97574.1 hypothetical protein [Marinitoga sp. 1138]
MKKTFFVIILIVLTFQVLLAKGYIYKFDKFSNFHNIIVDDFNNIYLGNLQNEIIKINMKSEIEWIYNSTNQILQIYPVNNKIAFTTMDNKLIFLNADGTLYTMKKFNLKTPPILFSKLNNGTLLMLMNNLIYSVKLENKQIILNILSPNFLSKLPYNTSSKIIDDNLYLIIKDNFGVYKVIYNGNTLSHELIESVSIKNEHLSFGNSVFYENNVIFAIGEKLYSKKLENNHTNFIFNIFDVYNNFKDFKPYINSNIIVYNKEIFFTTSYNDLIILKINGKLKKIINLNYSAYQYKMKIRNDKIYILSQNKYNGKLLTFDINNNKIEDLLELNDGALDFNIINDNIYILTYYGLYKIAW